MISGTINVTTGPVAITTEVHNAFAEPAISHRSVAFQELLEKTNDLLCHSFSVRKVFLLTGSGTLANEVMLQEIKHIEATGLILSNGEFGSRLIDQALRNNLDFVSYHLPWGAPFDLDAIRQLLIDNPVKWILFCHCETSTGIINDLDRISAIATLHNCLCFVDCMSTVGTRPIDLSKVAMATASSGKGLAALPGLAIVFSNIEPAEKNACPVYLDLHHHVKNGGIPFTISSNLVNALYASIRQKLVKEQFELIDGFSKQISTLLHASNLAPFDTTGSRVFTIDLARAGHERLIQHLMEQNLLFSHESNYLKARNWCQVALFGYYRKAELQHVVNVLGYTLQRSPLVENSPVAQFVLSTSPPALTNY